MKILVINGSPKKENSDTMHITRAFLDGMNNASQKEINPKESSRATAYELWMKARDPMVTFFKTLDVTNLLKVSKKSNAG